MMKITDTRQYSWLFWHLAILLLLISVNNFIFIKATPLPDTFPAEKYDDVVNNYILHRRIEDERKILEAQLEIQALLVAEAREQYLLTHQPMQREYSDGLLGEMLPVPSAQHAPDKRQNYMTLCHFKLCNMGRKRQL